MAEYFAGLSGDAYFENFALHVKEWAFTDSVNPLPTTSKQHNGYGHLITGVRTATGTCTAVWDPSIAPYNAAINPVPFIRSSNFGALVLKMTDCSTALCHASFPQIYILSVNYTSNVDGLIEINFSWQSNGEYAILGECTALEHCADLGVEEGPD